jgi:sigma-B regulation protein RsbU (phosphoserine phosphatase)
MFQRLGGRASQAAPADPAPRRLLAVPAPSDAPESNAGAILRSRMGRTLLVALAARLGLGLADRLLGSTPLTSAAGVLVSIVLGVTLAWAIWRLAGVARRRLLWRVRRKLILSYIFIGVVPSLLIVAFFLFAGVLMFFHVSAYLFKRGIDDIVEEARIIAQTAAIEIQRGRRGLADAGDVLDRKVANSTSRYPGLSIALVPRPAARRTSRPVSPVSAGPWHHDAPPAEIPEWVDTRGHGGLIAYRFPDAPDAEHLVIRTVGFPDEPDPGWGIVADLLVDERIIAQLRGVTGIELRYVTSQGESRVVPGRPRPASSPARPAAGGGGWWTPDWFTIFEYADWASGKEGTVYVGIRVGLREMYDRMSAAQSRLGPLSVGDLFVLVLGAIAVLFIVIEAVAFVMGLALARSITGSVHQLFVGTARVQAGDFSHRIHIRTRDQLGELAGSFNAMTSSIETLLHQAEEKKRLEEELRIAREIQMSLLPRGPLSQPGLAIAAICVPAKEVGGDYYDFFPLADRRLGVLIADVAGKGTSAALYMAELKGIMLSLCSLHRSPKALLSQVNRIISVNLDARSFITMTYAIVDLDERTLTYARAGHTPLIYLPSGGSEPTSQLLTPDGLVLGLRIDGAAARFDELLEERTLPLCTGDVFVLFTDGITEAMNPVADLFGDGRLQQLVEEHGHLPTEELRERVLRDVEAFVDGADQHDDMTMILIKVEAATAPHASESFLTRQAVS